MKAFFKNNGLTIILLAMFFASWGGQFATGLASHNEDLRLHHMAEVTAGEYLTSGHFIESTFENWESEFLQMAVFVWLTAKAYQRGSAESHPLPDERHEHKRALPKKYFKHSPFFRMVYENSLSIALLAIFFLSFVLHLYGGWQEENLKHVMTNDPQGKVTLFEFFESPDFWFQSFQNWQSEFLSVAAIVVLTIFLRQKDSAQSKPLDSPNWKTEG